MTSAIPSGRRLPEPLKMTSSIFSPRRMRALCSPSAQATASQMFDLPHPFGPMTAVMAPGNASCADSENDLKPEMLRLSR